MVLSGVGAGFGSLPFTQGCQIADTAVPGVVEEQKHTGLTKGVQLERTLNCGEKSMACNGLEVQLAPVNRSLP